MTKAINQARLAGAVLAGVLAFGASSANALLIDGFGNTQSPIVANSMTPSASVGPVVITDTDLMAPVSRTITVMHNAGPSTVQGEVVGGFYAHSQGVLTTGMSMIEWAWTVPADLSSFAAILIDVISVDLPGANISFEACSGGNCSAESFVLPAITGLYKWKLVDFIGSADFSAIDYAKLTIDGTLVNDLDVAIDFVASPVPEAATLGLFGLGLAGLGLAMRRRKTA